MFEFFRVLLYLLAITFLVIAIRFSLFEFDIDEYETYIWPAALIAALIREILNFFDNDDNGAAS